MHRTRISTIIVLIALISSVVYAQEVSVTEEGKEHVGYIVVLDVAPTAGVTPKFETTLDSLDGYQQKIEGKIEEAQQIGDTTKATKLESALNVLEKRETEIRALEQQAIKLQLETIKDIREEVLSETGIETEQIMAQFSHALAGISVDVTPEKIQEIKENPAVKAVYPNYVISSQLESSLPRIGAQETWKLAAIDGQEPCDANVRPCITGKGKKIGIIDSGVDYTHPDLGGCLGENCKVIQAISFIRDDDTSTDQDETDPAPPQRKTKCGTNSDAKDYEGHGTHVASIAGGLKGVAPDAKIISYKVTDCYGQGTMDKIITALGKAFDPNGDRNFEDKLDVIVLSLGGPGDPNDPASQALDSAVNNGVVAIVAAGNTGPGTSTILSPGTARKAITVGAVDDNDAVQDFSARGPVNGENKPNVVAPGVNICAARSSSFNFRSRCADNCAAWKAQGLEIGDRDDCVDVCMQESYIESTYGCPNDPEKRQVVMQGTSMAAPHVAGLAALLLQKNPTLTPDKVKQMIVTNTLNLGTDINMYGSGRIQVKETVVAPIPTPTQAPTPTPSPTPEPTATPSPSPEATETPTVTATPSPSPSPEATTTPSPGTEQAPMEEYRGAPPPAPQTGAAPSEPTTCEPGKTYNPTTKTCEPTTTYQAPTEPYKPPEYQGAPAPAPQTGAAPSEPTTCEPGKTYNPTTKTCEPTTTYQAPTEPYKPPEYQGAPAPAPQTGAAPSEQQQMVIPPNADGTCPEGSQMTASGMCTAPQGASTGPPAIGPPVTPPREETITKNIDSVVEEELYLDLDASQRTTTADSMMMDIYFSAERLEQTIRIYLTRKTTTITKRIWTVQEFADITKQNCEEALTTQQTKGLIVYGNPGAFCFRTSTGIIGKISVEQEQENLKITILDWGSQMGMGGYTVQAGSMAQQGSAGQNMQGTISTKGSAQTTPQAPTGGQPTTGIQSEAAKTYEQTTTYAAPACPEGKTYNHETKQCEQYQVAGQSATTSSSYTQENTQSRQLYTQQGNCAAGMFQTPSGCVSCPQGTYPDATTICKTTGSGYTGGSYGTASSASYGGSGTYSSGYTGGSYGTQSSGSTGSYGTQSYGTGTYSGGTTAARTTGYSVYYRGRARFYRQTNLQKV